MKKFFLCITFILACLFIVTPEVFGEEIYTTDKLIAVDTAKQRLYAWEGGQIIRELVVSTGLRQTPTVKGTFKIYAKIPSQTMRGYSKVNGWYNHPNVTDVMYFYSGYAIHGAYWHNNFGQPMSNGCVNLKLDDAQWLYSWAPKGTQVVTY